MPHASGLSRPYGGSSGQVRQILKALRDKEWPEVELTTLRDSPDRKVWRLDSVGRPRLYIYLGNWASESDLAFLREAGADTSDSFLFILVDQSLPSIQKVLAGSLKWWQRPSITVMAIKGMEARLNQVQDQEDALVSAVVERLRSPEVGPPPPIVPPVPPRHTWPPTPLVEPVMPRQLVLGDTVSKEELRAFAQRRDLDEDERREKLSPLDSLSHPPATATTHTAVFGTTNSGKSVTTKRLARELIDNHLPVTIIDWHDEYVDLVREMGGVVAVPPTSATKPGAEEVAFTWNVLDPRFYGLDVTSEIIEDYTEIVVDLLGHRDLMDLTEPMKGGLTEALKLAYKRTPVPTFREVLGLVDEVAIPLSTANAIQRRLQRFSGGSLGSISCKETSFDPRSMFTKAMGVRVNHLTADHESAVGLLTFFLLRQAISHFKHMGEVDSQAPVRHIIIIDEAPMVIGSNPKVERELVRMLQEVHKFGEGLILVCRNPSIHDDILRETNQKIAHRLYVPKDVASVGSMLGLGPEDRALLRSLPRGVAFARIAANPTALVRVKPR